jgi:hypothetical protein
MNELWGSLRRPCEGTSEPVSSPSLDLLCRNGSATAMWATSLECIVYRVSLNLETDVGSLPPLPASHAHFQ